MFQSRERFEAAGPPDGDGEADGAGGSDGDEGGAAGGAGEVSGGGQAGGRERAGAGDQDEETVATDRSIWSCAQRSVPRPGVGLLYNAVRGAPPLQTSFRLIDLNKNELELAID